MTRGYETSSNMPDMYLNYDYSSIENEHMEFVLNAFHIPIIKYG